MRGPFYWSGIAAMFVAVILQFCHLALNLPKWLDWAALPFMLYFLVVQFIALKRMRKQREVLR